MMSDWKRILDQIEELRVTKNWKQTDSLRVLAKSLVVESNELLELFLNDEQHKEAIANELADVLMYALSMAADLQLDIDEIIRDKIAIVQSRNYEH